MPSSRPSRIRTYEGVCFRPAFARLSRAARTRKDARLADESSSTKVSRMCRTSRSRLRLLLAARHLSPRTTLSSSSPSHSPQACHRFRDLTMQGRKRHFSEQVPKYNVGGVAERSWSRSKERETGVGWSSRYVLSRCYRRAPAPRRPKISGRATGSILSVALQLPSSKPCPCKPSAAGETPAPNGDHQ